MSLARAKDSMTLLADPHLHGVSSMDKVREIPSVPASVENKVVDVVDPSTLNTEEGEEILKVAEADAAAQARVPVRTSSYTVETTYYKHRTVSPTFPVDDTVQKCQQDTSPSNKLHPGGYYQPYIGSTPIHDQNSSTPSMSDDAYGGYDNSYDYYADEADGYDDVFCCLNPWMSKNKEEDTGDNDSRSSLDSSTKNNLLEVPNSSTLPGLSKYVAENDKKAKSESKHADNDHPNEPIPGSKNGGLKGILKNASIESLSTSSVRQQNDVESNRRSLFPASSRIVSHSDTGFKSKSKLKSLRWASMARVSNIPSRSDYSLIEREAVWWQRKDFDEFKKVGRIITRALLEGGSEIWLKSTNSTEHGGDEDGEKWWCKFGHSRRGLEHISNPDNGRSRQRSVNTAIKAVIAEQRKQQILGVSDPRKLAIIATSYTSWARDAAYENGREDEAASRSINGIKQKNPFKKPEKNNSLKKMKVISANANLLDANTKSNQLLVKRMSFPENEKTTQSHSATSMAKVAAGFGM